MRGFSGSPHNSIHISGNAHARVDSPRPSIEGRDPNSATYKRALERDKMFRDATLLLLYFGHQSQLLVFFDTVRDMERYLGDVDHSLFIPHNVSTDAP